ncbi:hypothetical protein SynBIOSE41_02527 [Synechococcus sp. BIOS-E4-1]|nr:hypothetical protein SynBIOSE41_02527 [Synechococcus sp. BIOS-E4-1]
MEALTQSGRVKKSTNSFMNHHRLELFGKRSQPEPPTYALEKS